MAPQTALWCPARAGLTGPTTECPLLRSLLGVKQTYAYALHMSAFDPKRTLITRTNRWRRTVRWYGGYALKPNGRFSLVAENDVANRDARDGRARTPAFAF